MTGFVIILVSAASHEEAKTLAMTLVEKALAACVQTFPIESVYQWNGAVEEAQEHLLICKGRAADVAEIEAAVRRLHSYDVPEIVCVPIVDGSKPYLAWMADVLRR